MHNRCTAQTKDGRPCSALAWKGDRCRWHAPELSEQRATWQAQGGAARSNRARAKRELERAAMTLGELDGLLCLSARQVFAGKMAPGQATALAALARAVTSVRETGELADRLAELEQRLDVDGRGIA